MTMGVCIAIQTANILVSAYGELVADGITKLVHDAPCWFASSCWGRFLKG